MSSTVNKTMMKLRNSSRTERSILELERRRRRIEEEGPREQAGRGAGEVAVAALVDDCC